MSVTLEVTDSYTTLAEAEGYLFNDSDWVAESSDENKLDALLWARWYLESLYDYDLDSVDVVDDEVKLATSILAADYVRTGVLFGDYSNPIKSKTIKAGPVQSTTVYATSHKPAPASLGKAKVLMDKVATRRSSTTVDLLRV